MAIERQIIHEKYAIYQGDCCEFMPSLKSESIHLSLYSPPFSGLYVYSSSEHDMSNCADDASFMRHYEFLVAEIARVTMPGRCTIVHCMDVPKPGGVLSDFPGDIIRLHAKHGFNYIARHAIWKEPLGVAIRTRSLGLTYRQLEKDSAYLSNAGADFVLVFRKAGANPQPISKPDGLGEYAGFRECPPELKARMSRDGTTSKYNHWVWQQYASAIWDDIRINRVLPYKAARDPEDEKHCHPLQLDVIERCVQLRSNPGEIVFTPFMGVGSEVYGALKAGRRAIGIDLKASYFNQAAKNVHSAVDGTIERDAQQKMEFAGVDDNAEWPIDADMAAAAE